MALIWQLGLARGLPTPRKGPWHNWTRSIWQSHRHMPKPAASIVSLSRVLHQVCSKPWTHFATLYKMSGDQMRPARSITGVCFHIALGDATSERSRGFDRVGPQSPVTGSRLVIRESSFTFTHPRKRWWLNLNWPHSSILKVPQVAG